MQQEDVAVRCYDKVLSGKIMLQTTSSRHYGKAMRQALRKDSSEGTAVLHAARHYGGHYGKKTPRQDTAEKVHIG